MSANYELSLLAQLDKSWVFLCGPLGMRKAWHNDNRIYVTAVEGDS